MSDEAKLDLASAWPALLRAALDATLVGGAAIMEVYKRDITVDYKADRSPLTEADRAAHRQIMARLQETGIPVLSEEGAAVAPETRRQWPRMWLVDPLDGTKEFIKRNGEFTVNVALICDHIPVLGVVYAPASQDLYMGVTDVGAFRATGVASPAAVACALDEPYQIGKPFVRLGAAPTSETVRVVASRSHGSPETNAFIAGLKRYGRGIETVSRGSSLKLCLVAAGEAHLYPRLAPTMEWDTAAAQAVVTCAGGCVVVYDDAARAAYAAHGVAALFEAAPLAYNRPNLLNPWFVALHPHLRTL